MGRRRTLREEVLREGLDDWVSARWVFSLALGHLRSQVDARSLSIGVITELVIARLMIAGSLGPSGYIAWDCSPEEAAVRIVREWAVEQRQDALINEVVWLDLTSKGQRIAESIA